MSTDLRKRLDEASQKLYPADFPILFANIREYRREQLTRMLERINNALEAGEIFNPRYNEAKESINRALEEAFGNLRDLDKTSAYRRREAGNPLPEDLQFLDTVPSSASIARLPGLMKRVAKIKHVDDPAATNMVPYLKEVAPLADVMLSLKDKITRRPSPKTDEEKRAEKFAVPEVKTEASAKIKEMLEQIADESFKNLVEVFTRRYNAVLDSFIKAQTAADDDRTKNRPDFFRSRTNPVYDDHYGLTWHFTDKDAYVRSSGRVRNINGSGNSLLAPHVSSAYGSRITFKPDVREKLGELALENAKEIRDLFVIKNLKKIASIVDGKGNYSDAKILGNSVNIGGLQGTIRFSFEDGSAFTVQNAVKFVVNQFGTQFNQFPLTFHDVVMPGGAKMPSPSEKRMNTVFLGKQE